MMSEEARQQRYRDFERFFKLSKRRFGAFERIDKHSHNLSRTYAFCPVPGGWKGGQEKHLVQFFFGQRPYEGKIHYVSDDKSGIPSRQYRLLTEAGALLQYFREPSGAVICTLEPASLEGLRGPEDAIVLERIADPAKLLVRSITRRHWRYFISYMHCTSLGGAPNLLDRARTAWIRFGKTRVVKNEEKPPVFFHYIGLSFVFFFTVGLSGWVFQIYPLQPTPDVSKVQIVGEPSDMTKARSDDSKKLDDIVAAVAAMKSDIAMLKSQTANPIAVKVVELPEKPKEAEAPPPPPKSPTHKKNSQ